MNGFGLVIRALQNINPQFTFKEVPVLLSATLGCYTGSKPV